MLSNCIDYKRITGSKVLLLKLCFRDCKIAVFLHTLNFQDQHVTPPLYAYPSKKSFVVVYTLKDPQCLSNAFQVLEKGKAQLSYRVSAKSESGL